MTALENESEHLMHVVKV